jgi:hypothetical protein
MPLGRALPIAASLALVMAATGVARADEPAGPTVQAGDDVELRLAWLERVLDREGFATRVWRGSWLVFYGGAAALEAVLAGVTTSPGVRVDSAVNAGKATIAFGFTFFSPASAGPLADGARRMPKGTRAERIAKLRAAEAALRAIAAEERDRRGWFAQVGGAALNAGGAWISFAGHKGNGALGWIGAATGTLVSELQFFTQPTAGIRAWEAYQRAGAGARLGDPPPVLRWSIGTTGSTTSVRLTF